MIADRASVARGSGTRSLGKLHLSQTTVGYIAGHRTERHGCEGEVQISLHFLTRLLAARGGVLSVDVGLAGTVKTDAISYDQVRTFHTHA